MSRQDGQHNRRSEQLNADWNDAPAWLQPKQPPKRSAFRRFALVYSALAIIVLGLYQFGQQSGLIRLLEHKVAGLFDPAPAATERQTLTMPPPADAQRTAQQLDPIQPSNLRSAPLSPPQRLDDCIKPGNLIDESVVSCRYGELPCAQATPAQGMVSADYLAQYQAEQTKRSNTPARRSAEPEVSSQWIRKWDGNGQFLAQWQAVDNRIDSSSVCANHKRGSIDYRECRKAAKQYFKLECRRWEQRWDSDRRDVSRRMEQRYCSAGNGFSPMG